MNIILRPGNATDANACGQICYNAFKNIAGQHNFPPDFPSPESAIGLMNYIFSDSGAWSVVAESESQIVGSNFLWEDVSIAGVGPITVEPNIQNRSVGRKLMHRVLQRAEEQGFAGVRLVQAAYHNRSM
ncbi:MAG: GNAT family N-acetyltransferase, partial [Bacteroidetes bacterium]